MTSGLSWPKRALLAVPVFFRRWNDIDVYIEDSRRHTHNIYCELINRVGNGRFVVAKVFPLGGRNEVLAACRADQRRGGRPRLYVIDGDLDLLTGEPTPPLQRLFRHKAYCIENYLIDETAAIEVLYEELADDEKAAIRKRLAFDKWELHIECVTELFVMFAVQKQLAPMAASVATGFSKIVTNANPPYLNKKSVYKLIASIYDGLCATHGHDVVMPITLEIYDRLLSYTPPSLAVSGKDYLLKLFRWYIAKQTKISATAKSLELRLAKFCNIHQHIEWVTALETTARRL